MESFAAQESDDPVTEVGTLGVVTVCSLGQPFLKQSFFARHASLGGPAQVFTPIFFFRAGDLIFRCTKTPQKTDRP